MASQSGDTSRNLVVSVQQSERTYLADDPLDVPMTSIELKLVRYTPPTRGQDGEKTERIVSIEMDEDGRFELRVRTPDDDYIRIFAFHVDDPGMTKNDFTYDPP